MILPAWIIGGLFGLLVASIVYYAIGTIMDPTQSTGRMDDDNRFYRLDNFRKKELIIAPIFFSIVGHFALDDIITKLQRIYFAFGGSQ